MNIPILLWIDLRAGIINNQLSQILRARYRVFRETNPDGIGDAIEKFEPQLLIFDYDIPNSDGLRALQNTKVQFPRLPILMLAEKHCEQLAIWAFRLGVRDYLPGPLEEEDLVERLDLLSRIPAQRNRPEHRDNLMALEPIPGNSCCISDSEISAISLQQILPYIEAHLDQRITLSEVAGRCAMSTFAFSRAFKKELGVTFQDYLIRLRIDRAQQLLSNPQLSVTDVASAAGFGDLSHFTRTFRRHVGTSPSSFRKEQQMSKSMTM